MQCTGRALQRLTRLQLGGRQLRDIAGALTPGRAIDSGRGGTQDGFAFRTRSAPDKPKTCLTRVVTLSSRWYRSVFSSCGGREVTSHLMLVSRVMIDHAPASCISTCQQDHAALPDQSSGGQATSIHTQSERSGASAGYPLSSHLSLMHCRCARLVPKLVQFPRAFEHKGFHKFKFME